MTFGGGTSLGNATGEIILDASGVRRGIAEAERYFSDGLNRIGTGITRFGQNLSAIGAGLTALTAPLVAFGATGLNAAADFDTLMNQIRVFGGVTGDELQRVSDYALELGAVTSFSASDAASAMLELMRSGMTLEQAMAAVPSVLDMAAAGSMSLEQAAGLASSGLAIFGLQAEDAAMVADALARAANASRANVSDLGMGLSNVGGIARQFGLSIEDTSAILAIFAQNGIGGAEAGTQLRSMLQNMSQQIPAVQAAWDELGVSLYNADGSTRDFNEVLLEMDAALDQLPIQEQNRLMQQLGGSYGVVGLTALRASNGIEGMLTAMGEAPAASTLAQEVMNSFAGILDSLGGSFETFQITVLTPFMNNTLKPLVEGFIEVLNSMTAWAAENPELVQTIVQVVAIAASLGAVLLTIGTVIAMVGPAFTALGELFAGVSLGPIVLLIGSIAALAWAFQTNFMGIQDAVMPLLTQISTFITGSVIPALQQLGNWFTVDVLPQVVAFVTGTVVPAIQSFIGFLVGFWTTVQPGLFAFADWVLVSVLPFVASFVSDVVLPALQRVADFLVNLWTTVAPGLTLLADWFLTSVLPFVTSFITETVMPALMTMGNYLLGIWDFVSPGLLALADWFVTSALPGVLAFISDTVMPGIQGFIDLVAGIWNAVSGALQTLSDGFTTTFGTLQGIIQPVIDLINSISGAVSGAVSGVSNFVSDTASGLGSVIGGGVGPAKSRDSGGSVQAGMPYLIGTGAQPELFIPPTNGTMIPNADKHTGAGGGEMTVNVNMTVTEGSARQAGYNFGEGLEEYKRSRG